MTNVPKIRFNGFTGDWKQRRLGEIFAIIDGDRGANYPSDVEFFTKGQTLFLDTKNVRVDGFRFATTKYISQEKDEILRSGKLETHDFVMTSRGTLGNVAYYGTDIAKEHPSVRINSAKLILRPALHSEVSDAYMLSVFRGRLITDFMQRKQVGSAQPHITKRDFSDLLVSMPMDICEQNIIGTLFSTLDTTIVAHNRKLEGLQKLKKAYLQVMFPQAGEVVPRVRFERFTRDWSEKRICDIFDVTRGQVLAATKVSIKRDSENIYPVYSSQTKNGGLLGYYNECLFDTAITWTTDGANAGTVNFREGKFYSTNVNGVLLSKEGYANRCTAEALNMVAWRYVSRVGNPKLMNNIMSEIKIMIPSFNEQIAIGDFFYNLDMQISSQSEKVEKLKQIKSSYLQKMFV